MSHPLVDLPCACPCGQTSFRVKGKPVMRFYCHCQICQALYQEALADVTVFWRGALSLPEQLSIQYKRHRPPPALKRGTCPACQAPVFGFLGLGSFQLLEFVSTRNFLETTGLPQPVAHIFYHRRQAEVQDSLPKISGYLASELTVSKLLLANTFAGAKDR